MQMHASRGRFSPNGPPVNLDCTSQRQCLPWLSGGFTPRWVAREGMGNPCPPSPGSGRGIGACEAEVRASLLACNVKSSIPISS